MLKTEEIFDLPSSGPDAYPQGFYKFILWLGGWLFRLLYRFEFEDPDEVLKALDGSSCIVAANHQSYFDPVFFLLAFGPKGVPTRFLCKDDFFRFRLLGHLVALCGAIPIKRDSADRSSIKRSVAALKRGEFVGIFPEGTRMKGQPGKVREFHAGVTLIARMADVPILPAAIIGAEKICPYGSHLMHFPKVRVRFGTPVYTSDFDDLPRKERNQACVDYVMQQVDELRYGEDRPEVAGAEEA